jgi:hypothetical protein
MAKEKPKVEEETPDVEYPTPVVGFPLNYYLKGDHDQNDPVAAVCTKIEGVGRIAMTVFRPGGHVAGYTGIYHISHPMAAKAHTWSFVEGLPGKDQYRLARAENAKKKRQQAEAEIQQREAEERMRKRREVLEEMNEQNPVIPT